MKAFCPNCEAETGQSFVEKIEQFNIRGESIPVQLSFYHCQECGADFEIPNPNYDPVDEAYREYRRSKQMVQPDEIKKFRKELGLTQKELSEILGFGIATLNRYENGALQTEAHDQIIRMCMQPKNLLKILADKPGMLSETTRDRLSRVLRSSDQSGGDLLEDLIEKYGNYPPTILSGFIRFDIQKFFQSIKFFCYPEGVVKTKLMKLLFYADFKHFKQNGISITGTRYAHAPHGPVPDQFATWLTALAEWQKEITIQEQVIGEHVGEIYLCQVPDWSVFSTSELAALATIKQMFQPYTARQIREYSHLEKGYQATKDGELISYQYAQDLKL